MRPDPRIPTAIRTARLDGLRLVSASAADFVIRAHGAVRDLPLNTPAAPLLHLCVPLPQTPPPVPREKLADKCRADRARIWAEFKGLTDAQSEDFLTLAIKGGFSFREAYEMATRSKVGV